jgi:sugar O-acyltransferase (sialic acid O-acetyltransferase NeuD family)
VAHDLIIVGAGGHGREVFGLVAALNAVSEEPAWNVIGFADDAAPEGEVAARLVRLDAWVVCAVDGAGRVSTDPLAAVVAVGDPIVRRELSARVAAVGVSLAPPLVHPSASIGPDVQIGAGSVVAAGSHITTNVDLGVGVQVNVGCSLSHDVALGDHVTLSPGCRLTGGVEVGDDAFFGVGAVVGPRVRIGAGARVGAGAVVLRDVEPGVTVHGVPARPSTGTGSGR